MCVVCESYRLICKSPEPTVQGLDLVELVFLRLSLCLYLKPSVPKERESEAY